MFDAETLRPNARYHVLALLAEHLGKGRRKQLVETHVTLARGAATGMSLLFAQGFVTGQAGNTSRVLLLVNKGGAVVTAELGRGWFEADCMATSIDARMGLFDKPVAKPCPAVARMDVGPWGVTVVVVRHQLQ